MLIQNRIAHVLEELELLRLLAFLNNRFINVDRHTSPKNAFFQKPNDYPHPKH
jgi:hypothetical protein